MPLLFSNKRILSVAVAVPLRRCFDFIEPEGKAQLSIGGRVKVPFGSRILIGIICDVKDNSDYPKNKLKQAIEILDYEGIFEVPLWSTLQWLSRYYLAPMGEVVEAAMPQKIRQGALLEPTSKMTWTLTELGRRSPIEQLKRAPLQLAIVKRFMANEYLSSDDFKQDTAGWRAAIKGLLEKGWLCESKQAPQLNPTKLTIDKKPPTFKLTDEQNTAVNALSSLAEQQQFSCSLVHGVTGSGKTQVYFSVMHDVIKRGQQVLLLVPEIGLTPQLVERIEHNFSCPIVVMHSALNETERHLAWWHAKQGNAKIILGTRSAIFSSFANLGLIVIDEEHDGSFKQQDGVRYQARDVAIYRAKQHGIPIILGSATPSLESYVNAQSGRYHSLRLEQRASKVELPKIELFDLQALPSNDGLSPPMLEAIAHTLQKGKQVMLFLNRRGYAPVLYCKECGETAKCGRCDSHLTIHRRANRLRCHHCGYECIASDKCGSCQLPEVMVEVGDGTQRVEEALSLRFAEARLLRIDRDSTRRKGELAELLEQARSGQADIILGTQLLTKGHDFPNVAMVGILGADQGLYSTDFRASETLFQQILQVSGRAGRRDEVGHVYIQTAFANHPFFNWVKGHDYDGFAADLINQRKMAAYPPFCQFALIRAESTHQAKALQFLRRAKSDLNQQGQQFNLDSNVRIMDAIPASMERRAGKYRAQLLVCSEQRSSLNALMNAWLDKLETDKESRKLAASVRWSLDIDPIDLF